jgi:peptidoglycan hydrolase CwlO-like protein
MKEHQNQKGVFDMKSYRMFLGLLAASLILWGVNVVRAQEEMTKDEWEKQIQDYTTQRNALKAQLDQLDLDLKAMTSNLADKDAAVTKCEDELYALVGATRAQVEEYRNSVATLENKVDALSKLSNQDLWNQKGEVDAAQNDLNELRKSKISLLTEFWDKLVSIQQKIDGLKSTLASIAATMEKWYTVGTWSKDRDCLWNIAKKKDIYDNAFMWPKIWQGNRDKIRDPDIIHPGQKLKIPQVAPLSKEEKSAANRYYRKKAG